MSDGICKCCGQTLPPAFDAGVPLTLQQQRIVDLLHKAGRHGMDTKMLAARLYADDPDGGPVSAHNIVAVQIHRLNNKPKNGWKIESSKSRGYDQYSRYRLVVAQ